MGTKTVEETMNPISGDSIDGEFRDACRALALLEEFGLESMRDSLVLMPILLSFLKHDAHVVVRQSIARGTNLFHAVLEEMLHKSGKVERWLEEMWGWMIKFKDAMYAITSESGSVRTKILAMKFLENYVLDFTVDMHDVELPCTEGKDRKFRLSRLAKGHPIFTPAFLASEANKTLQFLCNTLQLAGEFPGSFTIALINCLAAVARNRPLHFSCVLSALLKFDSNLVVESRGHAASIQYSLKASILGFVKCNHALIIESRDKLLDTLRAMNPGEATEQIIRRLVKMTKNVEYFSRDVRLSKDNPSSGQIPPCGDMVWNLSLVQSKDSPAVADAMPSKRTQFDMDLVSTSAEMDYDFLQNDGATAVNGSLKTSVTCGSLTDVDRMRAMVDALLAKGERGIESLEILISSMHSDLLADLVIENMKHLMDNPLLIADQYGDLSMSSHTFLQSSSQDWLAASSNIC